VISWLSLVAAVVLAGVWSALPWSWGFAVYYFCLALGLEALQRIRVEASRSWVPIVIVAVGVNVANRWFHADASGPRAVAYLAAVTVLSMALGTWAGHVLSGGAKNQRRSKR
jgi:hypothetical protein